MNELQKKLLELLTDVDGICKRENINYYLCDETAHGAMVKQGLYENCSRVSVAMTTENALKFIEAVKKENREDRIVDSMFSNKDYPDFTVSYGDANTTMMSLPYTLAGKVPCIAITIHMIRHKSKRLKKYYKVSKAFWEICQKDINECSTFLKRSVVFACHTVRNIFGATNVSRYLFKKWCSLFQTNKTAKKISICGSKFVFDVALLENDGVAMLEGREFSVFGDVDAYLNKKYDCEDFREIKPKYPTVAASLLVSAHIPYLAYLEKAKEMGVDFDAIQHDKKVCAKLGAHVSKYNEKISKYYAIVDRTEKRFAMYEKYMPMKKLLLKLYQEERYEELNELLKPYRSALWACYKKGLGLCFDKEIFEMTMHILQMEGSHTYVKKLRNMVPEGHWESMSVTDYKGELVEITDISELLPEYTDIKEESLQ